MDNEQDWIVSGRVGGSTPAPGSDIEHCHLCGHAVWISPSSLKVKASKPDMKMACMDCAHEEMKQHPERIMPINNAQIAEVARYFNITIQEARERLEAHMEHEFGKS